MLPPSSRRRPSLACFVAFFSVLVSTGTGCLAAHAEDSTPTACAAESNEPNDSEETAEDLGKLSDDPDSARSITSSVHTASDRDWYRVHIADRGLGGDPVIDVAVSAGFEVSTWFVCDNGRTASSECLYGGPDYARVGDANEGCRGKELDSQTTPEGTTLMSSDVVASSTTDCFGTSSDGVTLYIRVERAASAGSECTYGLTIDVK